MNKLRHFLCWHQCLYNIQQAGQACKITGTGIKIIFGIINNYGSYRIHVYVIEILKKEFVDGNQLCMIFMCPELKVFIPSMLFLPKIQTS